MLLRLKRIKELVFLFFDMVASQGLGYTAKKAAGFFKRRLRAKKGRFLPPQKALQAQKGEDTRLFPTISICTALYNTDPAFLQAFLDSFLAQSCQNGELCLADASDEQHAYVGQMVHRAMERSDRIRYVKLSENAGISANTNQAAKLAKGEYLALADHDDLLSPDACYQLAKAAFETKADFLYSDEALFTKDPKRPITGHFKPDFAPHYLECCNYICHLAAFKRADFWAVGGLCPACDGAQDHDLFLKLTEGEKTVVHIPLVLYYWRVHAASTSGGVEAKPYVTQAAIRAIDAHLQRVGIAGHTEPGLFPSTYRVVYQLPDKLPLISVIIPNKDHVEDLEKCLVSLYEKSHGARFEVLVVENNSQNPETFAYYETLKGRFSNLQVLYWQKGFNFSAINNFAREKARGEFLLLLNNDVEILTENWPAELLGLGCRSEVGAVGAKLCYPDGTLQHGGVITGLGGFAGHSHKYARAQAGGYMFRIGTVQDFSCCTAALLLVKARAFDAVGGLDEQFEVAFNDVDFCLRLRQAGWQVVYTPYLQACHYESKSRGLDQKGEAKLRFEKERQRLAGRFGKALLRDPFYNPNLTLDMENFAEAAVLPQYGSAPLGIVQTQKAGSSEKEQPI